MTTELMATGASARLFRGEDEEGVMALLRSAFGHWPMETGLEGLERDFFRWKHYSGPWGPSTLYVGDVEGRIVSVCAHMPWRITAPGGEIRAFQGVDAATEPALQRRGISQVLYKFVDDDQRRRRLESPGEASRLAFGTPGPLSKLAGDKARAALIRADIRSETVGTFGLSVRMHQVRVLLRRLGLGKLGVVRAEFATDVLEDTASVTDLVDEWHAGEERLATRRSVEYLRWRYPRFLGYHALTDERNGRLAGLAIFRVRPTGYGYGEARVLELLVAPGDHHTAARLLRRVMRVSSAHWLTCWFSPGSDAQAAVDHLGLKEQEQAMMLNVTLFGDSLEPDPFLFGSWSLTLGDVEELL